MQADKVIDFIVDWLKGYCHRAGMQGFVVGVSGGIDSAVTSTLCARTGFKVFTLNMPILQHHEQQSLAADHVAWLEGRFDQVTGVTVDLTPCFQAYETCLPDEIQDGLTMANTRSRLRMVTLYAFAAHHSLLVAGTGNKVEDFGVGFFTKYGDGGVDVAPIADLTKPWGSAGTSWIHPRPTVCGPTTAVTRTRSGPRTLSWSGPWTSTAGEGTSQA